MGEEVRRRRWEFWRREPILRISMHKSNSDTHLYLPSVISRWQASQHFISLTNHNHGFLRFTDKRIFSEQITIWPISGWHYSICSWPGGQLSHPQLFADWLREEPSHAPVEPLLATGYDNWIFRKGLIGNALPKRVTCTIFCNQPNVTAGSTTIIVVPLTVIGDQLNMECTRLGLSAVVGGQVVAHWSCLS